VVSDLPLLSSLEKESWTDLILGVVNINVRTNVFNVSSILPLSMKTLYSSTFRVLTAASVKTAVLWHVAPCSLLEVYRRFRGACCLHHQGGDTSFVLTVSPPCLQLGFIATPRPGFKRMYQWQGISRAMAAPGRMRCLWCAVETWFNSLKYSGNYMCHLLYQSVALHFAHRVYLWVSYVSQNEQPLFLFSA
jgi:hypothetical protein